MFKISSTGYAMFSNYKVIFNADGSGQLCNGAIWWDANGNGSFGVPDTENNETASSRPFNWDTEGELSIGGWQIDTTGLYHNGNRVSIEFKTDEELLRVSTITN